MPDKECLYHAYLLRCWREKETTADEKARWRFCVEEVLQKRPRQGFDSLDALVAFLQAELVDGDQHLDRVLPDSASEEKSA